MNRLVITICATEGYDYAMRTQARSVQANIQSAKHPPGVILLVGSKSVLLPVQQLYQSLLPDWEVENRPGLLLLSLQLTRWCLPISVLSNPTLRS